MHHHTHTTRAGQCLLDAITDPDPRMQRRQWTALCDGIEWLHPYRGMSEYAREPDADDVEAQLLHRLCDPATAELVRIILSGELRSIVEGRA